MNNIIKIAFYVVVVLALFIGVAVFIWGDRNPAKGSSISLILAYTLLLVAIGFTVVASIGNMIQHPKSSVKMLIGIGAVLVIGLIGYAVSSGDVLDQWEKFGVTTSNQSKWIDAAWYLVYGALGISIVGILVSEFSGLFKK
jgi:small-conductance mechanosensitive channel